MVLGYYIKNKILNKYIIFNMIKLIHFQIYLIHITLSILVIKIIKEH